MRLVFCAVLVTCGCALAAQAGIRAGKTTTGIAYDVRGSGPVVVLITGSNLDRRMWTREAEWLATDHTVVRYAAVSHRIRATESIEKISHRKHRKD